MIYVGSPKIPEETQIIKMIAVPYILYMLSIHTKYTLGVSLEETTLQIFQDTETVCVLSEKNSNRISQLTKLWSEEYKTIISFDLGSREKEKYCMAYLVEINQLNARRTLEKLSKKNLRDFRTHSRILIVMNNVDGYKFDFLFDDALKNDLDILILHQNLNIDCLQEKFGDLMVYSVLRKKSFVLDNTVLNEISTRPKWSISDMLKELKIALNISAYPRSPYVIKTEPELGGFDVHLVQLLFQGSNLQFELVERTIDPFAYIDEKLMNGTTDLSIGGLWFSGAEKKREIQATSPYYQQCLKIVVHKPTLLPDLTFMFQFFQFTLWVLLLVVTAGLAAFVAALGLVKRSRFPFGEALTVVVSILIGGSFEGTFTQSMVKDIVVLFWSLTSLLLVTYYNAGMITLMKLPRFTMDVKTFEDMVNMKIRWFFRIASIQKAVEELGGIHAQLAALFVHSTNSTLLNIMIRTGRYGTVVESLPNRLLANLNFLDDYSKGHLKIIDQCFLVHFVSFHTRKNSPYHDFINLRLMEAVSYGFLDVLMKDEASVEQKKVSEMFHSSYSVEVKNVLTLSKMQGAFLLLILGWACGIVVFFWRAGRRIVGKGHLTSTVLE